MPRDLFHRLDHGRVFDPQPDDPDLDEAQPLRREGLLLRSGEGG